METYINSKPLRHNPHFKAERQVALDNLDLNRIDPHIIDLVKEINRLPCLFTLQCCHGHFLKKDGKEISSLELLENYERVEYKLAYIALCIENSLMGNSVRKRLMNIPLSVGLDRVQFCSAQWFWERWLNSYALQVMPVRFKDQDTAQLEYVEAREVAKVRDEFYIFLEDFKVSYSASA